MGIPPCCDRSNVKKGLWTAEEDVKILAYVANHGVGNWTLLPKKAGLNRCGKSCRLRWTNYLRPDLKHDNFTPHEEDLIINLHGAIGSRWSLIAKQLPGRTDNDVKNYWNTKLRKKLHKMGIDPVTHKPFSQVISDFGHISDVSNDGNQISSFNKTLYNKLISKPESSSVFTGTSSTNINMKTMIEQVQDNSFVTKNPTSDFLVQFQVTNNDTMQPHSLNEASSSCSLLSSTTITQLSSSQSYSCQQSQPEIPPSSPLIWREFLISDPVLTTEFQRRRGHDFYGMLSSTNCSTSTQNDIFHCKFLGGNEHQNLNRDVRQSLGSHDNRANNGNQTKNHADASSSSASSFVDGILDKDREMCLQFPQLLDTYF